MSVPTVQGSLEQSVGVGMELAPATKETNGFAAVTAALWQLLLLIAIGYAASFIVPAGVSLAVGKVSVSLQASEEPRLSASALDQNLPFDAEICSSAPPQIGRRSPCEPPK
jgi:hypothetical protein